MKEIDEEIFSDAYFMRKALDLASQAFEEDEIPIGAVVVYENKIIHFGSPTAKTFLEHKDEKKRDNWRARHSKILNKDGQEVYKLKTSPSYWSWQLLW